MSETKTIIIQTIKDSDKFYNIIDNNNVEWGIGKDKNPVLAGIIAKSKQGDQITGNPWNKDGKNYLFDPKDGGKGGGKSFAPKDKSFESGIAAITAAAQMYSLDKDKDAAKVVATAETFHQFLMSKITK